MFLLRRPSVFLSAALLVSTGGLLAQGDAGRIFFPTPETVGIWEFNEFPDLVDGDAIPEGTLIPDLTGTGHDASVEVNGAGDLRVGPGDPFFDDPPGANRECERRGFGNPSLRVAVNEDNNDFEMEPTDDFTVELYINRETVDDPTNWGILAGTWHSRNVLDDSQPPDNNGAWYGYGLIRNDKNSNGPFEWSWVLSPVVDGVPRIGFGQDPEQHLQPFFDIGEGRHYVVLSVNRIDGIATGYVDGVEVTSRAIPPEWSFTTPDGYEHARFLMFSGEDDPTRGSFRGSPPGTHLDAVRVQRKALVVDEVVEIWDNIQAGVPSPPPTGAIRATILASATSVILGQCVRLSAESSSPGTGHTITKYEWKIADGPFEEGAAVREVSFDTTSDTGHSVQLRITNDVAETNLARVNIKVKEPPIAAHIVASLNGAPLAGSFLIVPRGSVLTLDGTSSGSTIPATALKCPIADNIPVEPSPVNEYRWDIDGKILTTESTEPSFDTPPYDTLGEFPVNLRVKSVSGLQATAMLTVKVVDGGRTPRIFNTTPDTICHFEFNILDELNDGTPIPSETVIEDLSGNGRDATVEGNESGDLVIGAGSPVYGTTQEANREIQRPIFTQHLSRLAINDDGDEFEMTVDDSFSVELFVDRETVDGSANWGILAGTWHSRNRLDDATGTPENDGAWYGYGLIRNDKVANPPYEWSWVLSPVVDGVPRIGFGQNPEQHLQPFFDIPAGRHYVVLSIDRTLATAVGYVDGKVVTRTDNLPPDWSFTTPDGYEHARFLMFSGEDDPTLGSFRGSPAGTHLDAVRVQRAALSDADVLTNWEDICAGDGADASVIPPGKTFHRGDADENGDLQLTDAIRILGVLFLGQGTIPCADAADADDNGVIQLTDAIRILGVLFLGQGTIPAPGPTTEPCGEDPTPDAGGDIGCETYTGC